MISLKNSNKRLIQVFSVFALLWFVFVLYTETANSGAIHNFNGWAWSADDNTGHVNPGPGGQGAGGGGGGNLPGGGVGGQGGGGAGGSDQGGDPNLMNPPGGLGWLSFNCTTGGNCASVDYGVDIDKNTGDLVGYAWSPNYGWLKFGGLNGFPVGDGTTSTNARIDLTTGEVRGWARFCAGADNPITCQGTSNLNVLKNGGWDGWVSLRGTGYGVSFVTTDGTFESAGVFSGFAWGGSDDGRNIVGWLDFSDVKYSVGPLVSIDASIKLLPAGGSTTIHWIGENLGISSNGCQTSGSANTGPDWYGVSGEGTSKPSPVGSFTTGALNTGSYTFSIQCLGADGITLSNIASVNVVVGGVATLNFFADPGTVYPPDFSTTLRWQTLNSVAPLENCIASSNPPLNPSTIPEWNGPVGNAPLAPGFSSRNVTAEFNPTNLRLTCQDALGNSITSNVSILRGSLLESLTFQATAVRLDASSGNFVSDFSWSGVNMDIGTCVGLLGGQNWPGPKAGPPGLQVGVIVPPTAPDFTTYALKCTGKYSGDEYIAEIKLNEGSGNTLNIIRPKYIEN